MNIVWILRHSIDGRDVLELIQEQQGTTGMRHTPRIGPGKELVLSTAMGTKSNRTVLDPAVASNVASYVGA